MAEANMFDDQAELDRKAAEMGGGRRTREPVPAPPEPSALDRAKGRPRPPGEDPVKKAAAEGGPPAPSETRPPSPAPPSASPPAIDTGRGPGGAPVARYGAREVEIPGPHPERRAELPPEPTPAAASQPAPGPAQRSPDNLPPYEKPYNDLKLGPLPAFEKPYDTLNIDPSKIAKPGQEGRPTSAGNVTPAGRGGGRGVARRGALDDQSRTAAYDPELDKMDPRNIGVIDTKGNVNQQVYAASPMAHPEAYPKGTDQFTKGTDTTGGATTSAQPGTTGALRGAVNFVKNIFHQGTPDQHTNDGYAALTKGAVGAPDDDTMRSVFAVVDPNNQLDLKHRMELATRTGYDWYMHQGQPEKAQKFATDALQYGNKMAQNYGDQAMKEFKAGNRDAAIKHLQTGYSWLPDGYHADPTADGKSLEIHDGKGKTVQTIPLDDKSIQNLSVGMATGTLYWDTVQHRAGVTQPFKPQTPPPTQAISAQPPQPGAPPQGQLPSRQMIPGTEQPPPVVPRPAAPAPSAPPAAPAPPVVTPPPPPVQQAAAQPAAAPAGPAPTSAAPAPPSPPSVLRVAPPPTLQPQPAAAAPAPPAARSPSSPDLMVPPPTAPRSQAAAPPPPPPPPGQAPEPPKPPSVVRASQPGQPGQGTQTEQKPQITLVRPNNDPDGVPTHITDGKNSQPLEPYRRTSVAQTEMVTRAREAVEQADQQHARQHAWITSEIAKLPGGRAGAADRATLAQYAKEADADHSAAVARHREVLQNWENQRREQDNFERTELKPQPVHDTDGRITGRIDKVFDQVVANKDKPGTANSPNLYANSPLRLEDKEGGRKEELKQIAIKLIEHNPDITPENAARYVIAMTAHVGDDENAKKASLNGATGEKGSRFRVENQDLRKQAVVAVVDGQTVTRLHIPKNVLNEIQRFKRESYGVEADKVKEEKAKHAGDKAAADLKKEQEARGERTGVGALVPEAARQTSEQHEKDPIGSAVTEITGAYAKFGTPIGWQYLVGKYGDAAARAAFERLGRRVPEIEAPPPEPGRGQPVMPAPGT